MGKSVTLLIGILVLIAFVAGIVTVRDRELRRKKFIRSLLFIAIVIGLYLLSGQSKYGALIPGVVLIGFVLYDKRKK